MNNPTIESQTVQPREIERMEGGGSGYMSRIYPLVYGGLCEACGVMDKNQPSHLQYKLCPHYRGMTLACSECEPTKDQNEVARISKLKVYDHPFKKDSYGRPILGVVCDATTCQQKFHAKYG